MKNLIMILLLFACAKGMSEDRTVKKDIVAECIQEQVDLYGDLCAESGSGYEEMNGSEAHFEGVRCAVESINICLEAAE